MAKSLAEALMIRWKSAHWHFRLHWSRFPAEMAEDFASYCVLQWLRQKDRTTDLERMAKAFTRKPRIEPLQFWGEMPNHLDRADEAIEDDGPDFTEIHTIKEIRAKVRAIDQARLRPKRGRKALPELSLEERAAGLMRELAVLNERA